MIWPVGEDLRPERGLVAAICMQGVADAQAGEPEAVRWCEEVLPGVLEVLGLFGSHDWHAATPVSDHHRKRQQARPSSAERSRLYRQRKRAERGAITNHYRANMEEG